MRRYGGRAASTGSWCFRCRVCQRAQPSWTSTRAPGRSLPPPTSSTASPSSASATAAPTSRCALQHGLRFWAHEKGPPTSMPVTAVPTSRRALQNWAAFLCPKNGPPEALPLRSRPEGASQHCHASQDGQHSFAHEMESCHKHYMILASTIKCVRIYRDPETQQLAATCIFWTFFLCLLFIENMHRYGSCSTPQYQTSILC